MTTNEEFLLEELQKGSQAALNKLYQLYWKRLYAFAYKFSGGDESTSERVVQDVFIYIWENRNSLNIHNLKSYLFQAVKYQLFSYYNQQNNQQTIYLEEQFEEFVLESVADQNNEAIFELLNQAIASLPERRKEIVQLTKIKGLSIAEVAEQLDIAPQTVKNQLLIAMNHLKSVFKKGGEEV
ncbi:RNA polymerase sigma-70 factor (ECF subfamily) [Wenyingzhuangia heitensis]|uniref:RNA polymerase sigma-70 factor (ECF subfamily) n=1 Tax=Wenyingzhuangia heitensis TaxID=1487859 RepID=A0ABX0U9X3_9FLAO|nr:RNA polymerase sigma-70 factor (ECF subfamily) [Wenyingzhuangia heitensis]